MKTVWIYENGQLEARNAANELLRGWPVDEQMGRVLCEVANATPIFRQLMLWPLSNVLQLHSTLK